MVQGGRGKGADCLCILLNCVCAADAASRVPPACFPATPHQTSRTSHQSSVTLSAFEFLRPGPRAVTLCRTSRSAVPRAQVPRAAAAADAAAEGSGARGTPDAPRDVDLAARRALEGYNAVGDRQADLAPRACAQWSAATTASAGQGWREHRWVGGGARTFADGVCARHPSRDLGLLLKLGLCLHASPAVRGRALLSDGGGRSWQNLDLCDDAAERAADL